MVTERQAAYTTKRRTEHQEQAAVIQWANLKAGQWPELDLLYAIPNGAKLAGGARAWARLRAEGAKAGVPDLCLPVRRNGYNGLYIELKVGRNKPSEAQVSWLDRLQAEGYQALACWGADEAIAAIVEYLESGYLEY